MKKYFQENPGYCYVCHNHVMFRSVDEDFRNHYYCDHCCSIPRMRALYYILHLRRPGWRELGIHECSPHPQVIDFFRNNCQGYVPTYYYPDIAPGTMHNGFRCENLQGTTFADNSLDLVITSDVLEHIIDPRAAFRDIARTLKLGGMHIFTVPAYFHLPTSEMRVKETPQGLVNIKPPQYHGDPINSKGALVTIDYGLDIGDLIFDASGLVTTIYVIRDPEFGILGPLSEVFVSVKATRKREHINE